MEVKLMASKPIKMFHSSCALFLATSTFLLKCCLLIAASPSNNILLHHHHQQQQQPLQHQDLGTQFSCGKLYYRTFQLDQQRDVLYVGAMDNIFRVNLANINKTNCQDDAIRLESTDTQKCITRGKSDSYDCRNHIKVIQPMNKAGSKLYICGTNAYNPKDYMLHANNLTINSDSMFGIGFGNAQAECPFDPEDNSTAVWVEHGNPQDIAALYTGTVTDFNKADSLIFRTELYNQTSGLKVQDAKRTSRFDSKALDKPNFVGSFEIGEYVYFFFRESAVEYINCGKSIYSRVARVCKRDNGYKAVNSEKVWTTFLKARLNCSIPGEFPFYFDEIQSVYRNPYDDKKFHAVFTTSNNGLTGSAICTFSLDSFQEVFNGKFKEQLSSGAAWLPVSAPRRSQDEPRVGNCVDDSLTLSESSVNFIRNHPLMDSAVANDNGKPLFFRRDVMFTKIVVDLVEIDGVKYTIYFVGTNTGHVYKIVEWYSSSQSPLDSNGYMDPNMSDQQQQVNQQQQQQQQQQNANQQQQQFQVHSTLVEIIDATVPEPVRAMEISSKHKSLYVGSDSQIKQINLLNCKQKHDNCLQCIRDPYCGWDRKHLECRHFSPLDPANLIQDVTNETPDLCHTVIKHKDVHVTWGQSVHLPCRFNGFIQESQDLQQLLSAQQRHNQQQKQLTGLNSVNLQSALSNYDYTGQSHGLLTPANYIQWYYHRRENVLSPGYPVLQRRDKFILAADQGLVILNANEPGWYQCRLGSQIIYSYNLIIDTKTCAAPSEIEFKRVYADWCREVERYKLAYRSWHAKQNRCQASVAPTSQSQAPISYQPQPQLPPINHQDIWTARG